MNINFLKLFLNKCNFREDAAKEITAFADTVIKSGAEDSLDGIVSLYTESHYDFNLTDLSVKEFSEKHNFPYYSVWLLVLIFAAEATKTLYLQRNIDEAIFWETFADLKFKAYECKTMHDIYGTFVAEWYPRFYKGDIFKFGCMQYDSVLYPFDTPFVYKNLTVKKGDPIKAIHIPSSGEPFNENARIESYKKAYNYFCDAEKNEILVCRCNSWLLYPEYKKILPESSNILSFANEFDIVCVEDIESFSQAWLVYGKDSAKAPEDLPEVTSLQRAFKKHLLSGGKFGTAVGIMLFDGEKVLTKSK